MAQDFTRYAVQATNSAGAVFTANSNDAVIGIRIANILTSAIKIDVFVSCLLYTSPSPRDGLLSRMPSSA